MKGSKNFPLQQENRTIQPLSSTYKDSRLIYPNNSNREVLQDVYNFIENLINGTIELPNIDEIDSIFLNDDYYRSLSNNKWVLVFNVNGKNIVCRILQSDIGNRNLNHLEANSLSINALNIFISSISEELLKIFGVPLDLINNATRFIENYSTIKTDAQKDEFLNILNMQFQLTNETIAKIISAILNYSKGSISILALLQKYTDIENIAKENRFISEKLYGFILGKSGVRVLVTDYLEIEDQGLSEFDDNKIANILLKNGYYIPDLQGGYTNNDDTPVIYDLEYAVQIREVSK